MKVVKQISIKDLCIGVGHVPLEDLCVGIRQLPMVGCYSLELDNSQWINLVGIKQFQLEKWMDESSWNYIVLTNIMDDWVKLELDNCN